ncbi:MAG TPA: tellurium resistance protein TerY [Chromatiaceae bacterium]|nr:MAG: VWA domain-containing protein [Thiohalocapsa sp. PB-PSB1]HBG94110.1 tellurium resistance protein TerY [Chromatiaceae bacterium]HCS91736.1 tellurium resistance protein TerY [Chromatiaceae bacterium]
MTTRRLPVYILVDTSGSMRGEPVQALNVGLKTMEQALRRDPFALDTVHLSLITFDIQAKELFALTPIDQVRIPNIEVPSSGATFLGAALKMLAECVDRDLKQGDSSRRGDWRPLAFVMTDGSPSDIQAYKEGIAEIKRRDFARIIACAAGPRAKRDALLELTNTVVALDTLDGAGFAQFFQWVSSTIAEGGRSGGIQESDTLPDLPGEVKIAF